MAQPLASLSAGNPFIQAPVPGPKDKPAGRFADPLAAFQVLFKDGDQFEAPSSWERVRHLTPQPILSLRRSRWNIEVDGAKRRVAHFLNVGKLEQAARASYHLGETYWKHFLIRHAEQAYFFGAAVAIGKADLTTLDLGDTSLRKALFAEMTDKGVAESRTAPSELNVGDKWPVFTPLLHGGEFTAVTRKYVGLPYVIRKFDDKKPVSDAEGAQWHRSLSVDEVEEIRDAEIRRMDSISQAGISIAGIVARVGRDSYVREFVSGEVRGNMRHSRNELSERKFHLALAGYNLMVVRGISKDLWSSEPPTLKINAVYAMPPRTETPEDLANWVVIEPVAVTIER